MLVGPQSQDIKVSWPLCYPGSVWYDYFTVAFLGGPEGPFVMSPALFGLLVFASACLVSHKGKVSDHTSIVVLLITDYPEER